MNIFLISLNPNECAKALCDLRLNKMILETAQMLSVAYRHHFGEHEMLYKQTHVNHPCTKWACEDISHYIWLVSLFKALAVEKHWRSNLWHLSYTKLYEVFDEPIKNTVVTLTKDQFTFNCSNTYPSTGDVFEDYKVCLRSKWDNDNRQPTWSKRNQPEWY